MSCCQGRQTGEDGGPAHGGDGAAATLPLVLRMLISMLSCSRFRRAHPIASSLQGSTGPQSRPGAVAGTMADFTRYVANKLSGEWSASNVSGVLTDTIIDVSRPPEQAAVREITSGFFWMLLLLLFGAVRALPGTRMM